MRQDKKKWKVRRAGWSWGTRGSTSHILSHSFQPPFNSLRQQTYSSQRHLRTTAKPTLITTYPLLSLSTMAEISSFKVPHIDNEPMVSILAAVSDQS
jgi:hypothetical protein